MSASPAAGLPLLLALLAAAPARAAEQVPPPGEAVERPAWSAGEARPFVAAQGELGTTEHLRVAAGWGQPWWRWAGLIADGWINGTMATGAVGARAALLAANLDVHWRTTRSWTGVPMPLAGRHLEVARGGGSTLHAWDVDLWGVVPTPGGYLTWEGQATRLVGVPRDVHVFDEGVHGIVRAPWSGFAGLGWVADLRGGDLQLGASADAGFLGRGRDLRWRAGPQASWDLARRWTLRGQVLFTVASPDRLATWPSLSGGVTVGYRWASGAPW